MTTTLTLYGLPVCSCLLTWVPAFEEELRELGIIDGKLSWSQFIGRASASALVHSTGGAGDCWETDERISIVARRMGAVSHPRISGPFEDNQHTHLTLIGCTHLHQQGKDQIKETYAGGDGLLGDVPDDSDLHAALWPKRTWREGIAWHKEQQLRRKRIAKLEATRARKAKWQRWVKRANLNIDRLKGLL